jgi:hypothetical protein
MSRDGWFRTAAKEGPDGRRWQPASSEFRAARGSASNRRSELQQAMPRPTGDEAQQVAQVGKWLDPVEPSAGEQRDEDRVHEGAVVAADEKPISTSEDLAPQVQLADVVGQGEPTVVEEAAQGNALVARVADRRRQRRLIQHLVDLGVAPFVESIHQRPRLSRAALAPSCREASPRWSVRPEKEPICAIRPPSLGRVNDHRGDESAEIDQMMPVAPVPRESRSLDAEHSPHHRRRRALRGAEIRGAPPVPTRTCRDPHRCDDR